MTPKIATTTFTTQFANLPDGMVPLDGFLVEMFLDGVVTASVSVPNSASHATFMLDTPGVYYAVVSKMSSAGEVIGSAASAEFTLEQAQVEVPFTVTVSLVDAVATPKQVRVSVK
jgi:hypothetical protein